MVFPLLVASLALQKRPPTTPIADQKKKPPVTAPSKKVTSQKPPVPAPKAVTKTPQPPVFADEPAGSGAPVRVGDVVTVDFLVKRPNGQHIAETKRQGLAYTFKLGDPGNDPLLEMVVRGMKVGGTRKATLSAKEVYGAAGAPPLISEKDTLIVVVTLLRRGEK